MAALWQFPTPPKHFPKAPSISTRCEVQRAFVRLQLWTEWDGHAHFAQNARLRRRQLRDLADTKRLEELRDGRAT